MNFRNLTRGLQYLKEVESKKQTYYILQSQKQYLLMSLQTETKGNFTIVEAAAVNYVFQKVKGKKNITANDIIKISRKPNFIYNNFDALNIAYVLVAMGKATIDSRFKDNKMHFNFKSE